MSCRFQNLIRHDDLHVVFDSSSLFLDVRHPSTRINEFVIHLVEPEGDDMARWVGKPRIRRGRKKWLKTWIGNANTAIESSIYQMRLAMPCCLRQIFSPEAKAGWKTASTPSFESLEIYSLVLYTFVEEEKEWLASVRFVWFSSHLVVWQKFPRSVYGNQEGSLWVVNDFQYWMDVCASNKFVNWEFYATSNGSFSSHFEAFSSRFSSCFL